MSNYKAGFPYLVDMKITDFCPFGCPFCYQSSTKNGKQAKGSYFFANQLPKALKLANVFEINFGGGEPTLFKDNNNCCNNIADVLKCYSKFDFKLGLTTKNFNWHKDCTFEKSIAHLNSVALSCNTVEEVRKAKSLAEAICEVSQLNTSVYAQIIFGLKDYPSFKEVVSEIVASRFLFDGITFLGFKNYGLGKGIPYHQYPEEWIDFIKSLDMNIGVDSIMVEKYKDQFIEIGVPKYALVAKEGSSTCYIDAVEMKIYPSSFSDHSGIDIPTKSIQNENLSKEILKAFATF